MTLVHMVRAPRTARYVCSSPLTAPFVIKLVFRRGIKGAQCNVQKTRIQFFSFEKCVSPGSLWPSLSALSSHSLALSTRTSRRRVLSQRLACSLTSVAPVPKPSAQRYVHSHFLEIFRVITPLYFTSLVLSLLVLARTTLLTSSPGPVTLPLFSRPSLTSSLVERTILFVLKLITLSLRMLLNNRFLTPVEV